MYIVLTYGFPLILLVFDLVTGLSILIRVVSKLLCIDKDA